MERRYTGFIWAISLLGMFLGGMIDVALSAERRTALVIGNAAYQVGPLANPVNDAEVMVKTLRELGFETMPLRTNVSRQQFREAIESFSHKLVQNGGVGLFYFAGHGMQTAEEQNYLMPIDARLTSAADVEDAGVRVKWIVDKMAEAGNSLNILILDACRNNPYPSVVRSGTRGLARMVAPVDTLIAYAAAPGTVARDGTGRNSVYTTYLVQEMRQPGLLIEQVFKRVRTAVMDATGKGQRPEKYSNLRQDFAFVEGIPAPVPPPRPAPPQPQAMMNSIGMEFVRIPAGEFSMGADDGVENEKPVHRVRISTAFDLAKFETTQEQWESVMGQGNNPSRYKGNPRLPVENVSFGEVQEFIRRLNAREGGAKYRLPTEAEWEYAARGSDGRRYPWGHQFDGRFLNFCDRNCELGWKEKAVDDGHATTAPVGSYASGQSPFGVHDMAGNVWEWVEDWYDAGAYKKRRPAEVTAGRSAATAGSTAEVAAVDPRGPAAGSIRVIRGGSWHYGAGYCRSAYRNDANPGYRYDDLGFRLVRTAK